MNEPNKLECYITLGWKVLPGKNTLAYFAHLHVLKKMKCWSWHQGQYSQYFILFVTNECTAQSARVVLHYTRLESSARDKHSSLFGPVVSSEENEVLWSWHHGLYSQHPIFLITN